MRGGRMRQTIFPETQYSANKKCREEKRRKKVRTTFLYIHTNIVNKKRGEQTRESIFPETLE